MSVKDFYGERKKEKKLYNTSIAAASRTQNTPQNSTWDAGQSTARLQSDATQKPKRKKTPSELGEEVVQLMLEDEFPELRQPAAATATASAAAPVPKAAGNRKTAQYGDAAGRVSGSALYSNPSVAQPAIGNQKAKPYAGTATARYNSPAAAKPAVQKREKSPSELGEEVLRIMLEDEGILKPPAAEEKEAPASRTFTAGVGRSDIVGAGASTAWNSANNSNVFGTPQSTGEDAGPTQTMPDWLLLMSMSDPDHPGLAAFANQVGFGLKESATQFTPDKINQLAPDWLGLMSMSGSDYPGLPAAANQFGLGLRESAAQFTPNQANQLARDWLPLLSMPDLYDPGLATAEQQYALLFDYLTKPLWDNTHLAVDTWIPENLIQEIPQSGQANPGNDETVPVIEALPGAKRNDILGKEQDSIQHEHKEWWEKPGASETIDPDDPAYQAMNAKLTDDQRASGLSIVKIDGEYYVDVTIMINTRLQKVEQDFRNHFIDFQNSAIDNPGLIWANTAWFISQVKGGAPWDIKLEGPWLQQFGDVLKLNDMSETIAYNGQVVTPENLGNLTYGYLGRAMGWPAETLYLAGGIYNQFQLAEELAAESAIWAKKEGKIDPGLIIWFNFLRPSLYSDGSYGDGENDTLFVKKGVELYEAVH